MKTQIAFLTLLTLAMTCSPAMAQSTFDTLEQQFRGLPMEARRLTGPLFWLHGDESQELLEAYVEKVAEGGNGCLTTESRPHNDWLGPNWYRDVKICLDAAKEHGLKLWIFDEKWWPSQGVAGLVPERYAAKQLAAEAVQVNGPVRFHGQEFSGENFIAVLAGRVTENDAIDPKSLIDLTQLVQDDRLSWEAPEGTWRIMKFYYTLAPGLGQGGGRQLSVDGMSKDCVDWYLETVYQPHYKHFKEDFGETIVGFFYDEPETRGDWGTELNKVMDQKAIDWKQAYVAYKFQLEGEAQAAALYQYLEARAETWGRTMYGGITSWCEERGVQSIGHFMEHSGMYRLQDFCAGDMMRVQKYSSMGGIDAVFDQFKMGRRDIRDVPSWQTPKLGSSISHVYGKPDDIAMVEIFGARGQDLTYPEMKWWTDHMQVSGINFLIPHSFNPKSPYDTDCPPYFYNNGFEPRWPLYRVFADYTSRLSVMLTGGRHVAPVALLSPGQSLHVGKGTPIEQISESLQDALFDCDWIPFEVFDHQAGIGWQRTFEGQISNTHVKLFNEQYKILVIPPVEVIPYATLKRAKSFFDEGGTVVAHDYLPSRSATIGKSAADIQSLVDAIWGSAEMGLTACNTNENGGRAYLLPANPTPEQIQQAFAEDAGIHPTLEVIDGETNHWLHVLHRVKDGRDLFFITNQNSEGDPEDFIFRVRARGVPECWDALRNEITAVPYSRRGGQVQLHLTLAPNESALLVFQPGIRELPKRIQDFDLNPVRVIPLALSPADSPAPPKLESESDAVQLIQEGSWTWYPEGNPSESAPPGTRYFRKTFHFPADRGIRHAVFAGTADNSFELFLNGEKAGGTSEVGESWRDPVEIDVRKLVSVGPNQLAIKAVNGSDQPNPAGLLGVLQITFMAGDTITIPVDGSWKTSKEQEEGWTSIAFDDSGWLGAVEIAKFGDRPWGRLSSGRYTIHPVTATPVEASVEIPDSVELDKQQIYLEMDSIEPEAAARVAINGEYAGGLISQPLRLNVTRFLRQGANSIHIEPFAPAAARLAVYDE